MSLRNWVIIVVCTIVGILALFMAAGSVDPTTYDIGLFVFVLAVAGIFFLVKRTFDLAERQSH